MKHRFIAILLMAILATSAYAATPTKFTSVTVSDDLIVEDDASVLGDLAVTGSVSMGSYAETKSRFITAMEMKLPSSAPATAGEQGSMGTLEFADSSADDNAFITWVVPYDCDVSADASIYVYYVLPSGTAGVGTWNFYADSFVDGTVVAAAATDLTTISDYPQGSAKTNITTQFSTIPAALIVADGIVNINIYHDVAEQFGGTVELMGVRIDYTSDKP